jgi:uncharacterized protein with HEPN domain
MSKRSDALYIRDIKEAVEAVGNLADNVKENYPHIAWQDIKDFRNLLAHEYFRVDLEIGWNIIQSDLPSLSETIEMIDKKTTYDS